jgi:hypothetical protein
LRRMRRTSLMTAASLAAAAVLTGAASAAVAPIVSPRAYPYYNDGLKGTKGFGQVKPRTIFYGGDPTGLVCYIHWQSWGGPVARGTGVGLYVGGGIVANGHAAKATVVASKLGTWKGRPAYNKLTWSFPDHGRDLRPRLCL